MAASATTKVGRLVLVRHGESIWNVTDAARNLVTRFTGWIDVPLTERGRMQARAAGKCLRLFGVKPDAVFTSLLKRANDTFHEIERISPCTYKDTSVVYTWRLNERHYGSLVGLSKDEASRRMGEDLVMEWRRSWDARPPPAEDDPFELTEWENLTLRVSPQTTVYKNGLKGQTVTEKGISFPRTESLQDCLVRIEPIMKKGIYPRLLRGETVLVVAHANTIRAMIRYVDLETMSTEQVRDVSIPSAVPLVYDFHLTDRDGVFRPSNAPTTLGMRGRYLTSYELITHQFKVITDDEAAESSSSSSSHSQMVFFDLLEHGLEYAFLYASIYDVSEAIVITNEDHEIIHVTAHWEHIFGFRMRDIKDKKSTFLHGPKSSFKLISRLEDKVQTGLPAQEDNLILYGHDGLPVHCKMLVIPIYEWLNGSRKMKERKAPEKKGIWGIGVTPPRDIHIPTSQALVPDYFIYSYKPIKQDASTDPLTLPVSLQPLDHRSFTGPEELEQNKQSDDDHSAHTHVLDAVW